MHQVTPFNFQDSSVRTITDDQNEIWFVAKDVCDILEQPDHKSACRKLDEDEKGGQILLTPGGKQEMLTISESGLYTLIIRSNKKQAKPFRRWVTHEVLPQIRKTGTYSIPDKQNKILALEEEIKEGASLLTAVICQQKLSEVQKWQLVGRLFKELFGRGTELLWDDGVSRALSQSACPGPKMYHIGVENPLLVMVPARSGEGYRVELSKICCHWFTELCCEVGDLSCSQRSLYTAFCDWFAESFRCEPPSFQLFHDAINAQYREINMVGEPWFVGIAPIQTAVEVVI